MQEDMPKDMDSAHGKETPEKRREHPVFTLFVHVGYTILILSMISWVVYLEFFL